MTRETLRIRKQWLPKPIWLEQVEQWIAQKVPFPPLILSSVKFLLITPLMLFGLRQIDILRFGAALVLGLFLSFAVLDYFDQVIARHRNLRSRFDRIIDRLADYPLLLVLSWFCVDIVPSIALVGKLSLELLLLILYVLGRGKTENRVRTTISYAALLSLLLVSQGWLGKVMTPLVVEYVLYANIAYLSIRCLSLLHILQTRFIADALSGVNLLCGVFSMIFAAKGKYEISFLFLMIGAAFDGFDGAAARKWGGTKWGVYSDDIADGVNYGIAPGVTLYFVIGGLEGAAIGIAYSLFTIGRLVFFTLNKDNSDPNYFSGIPSPVAGFVVMSSLVLFQDDPVWIGLMVGIACTLMVSFSSQYRHLGRALGGNKKKALIGLPVYVVMLIVGLVLFGKTVPIALILAANLLYGFFPALLAFKQAMWPTNAEEVEPSD